LAGKKENMNTLTKTQVRLFASTQSWIEGEAVRQIYATAKLDGVRHAVGFTIYEFLPELASLRVNHHS